MGLTQHANGTDLVTSLLNLMLACGMIGRWGAAMMPVRGQNNVQGASDVGAIPFVYTDYRSVKEPKIRDRKSTRLNSSHSQISYAVFCLKKKKNIAHSRT